MPSLHRCRCIVIQIDFLADLEGDTLLLGELRGRCALT
jgi:hypothetical protein